MPVVFLHGLGFGAVPYFRFFQSLRDGYSGPLVAIELPNCSRASFQDSLPTPASFRYALRCLLEQEFGIRSPGRYALVAHSLGTALAAMVLNDPCGAASPTRPARMVLIDPVCFAHELPGTCEAASSRENLANALRLSAEV